MVFDMSSETELHRRSKHKIDNKAFKEIVIEYCQSTSIHGIQYLGDKKRSVTEKYFWIVMIILSLIGCGYFIKLIVRKWDENPVIVSLSEKELPIWEVPFPAITVCPEIKTKTALFNYTKIFQQLQEKWELVSNNRSGLTVSGELFKITEFTEFENETLELISQICNNDDTGLLTNLGNFTVDSNTQFIQLLKDVSLSYDDIFMKTKFRDLKGTFFKDYVTEEGLCYTFNALDGRELYREELIHDSFPYYRSDDTSFWSLENGYNSIEPSTYPYRLFPESNWASLSTLFKVSQRNLDQLCRGPSPGLKIYLHTPGELPSSGRSYKLPLDQKVNILVTPKVIISSENLKSISPARRQCFFNGERYLRYFKLYTRYNCEIECRTNYTLNQCGCVPYFMPRDKSTPICGLKGYFCSEAAKEELFFNGIVENLNGTRDRLCDCMTLCTSITYDAVVTSSKFIFKDFIKAQKNTTDDASQEYLYSHLEIYSVEDFLIPYKRSELYGPSDFFSNFGGLMGLFMGVSFLSIIEMVYFCSVRLYRSLKRDEVSDGVNELPPRHLEFGETNVSQTQLN